MVIVGDFNTTLSTMDRSSRQKINKDIAALNNTLDEMDLIYICKTSYPKEVKYTFFSNVHGSLLKRDHMDISLKHFKKIKIISSIFLDRNGLKPESSHKRKKPNKQSILIHGG